jgi:thioredoxin reductase (NADPH)
MDCDCVIVGTGPAGLHTGVYLGRYLRSVIAFNSGKPRAEWIPVSHNCIGFPQGISGLDLLRLLRRHAEKYGAEIRGDRVVKIEGSDGNFLVKAETSNVSARKIVLATGVTDIPPDIPDADRFKGRTIRHCPICDAYESRGRKIVMFAWGDSAADMAIWLAHYTREITIVTTGHGGLEIMSSHFVGMLEYLKIPVIDQGVVGIEEQGDELGTVVLENGMRITGVQRGYSAMGVEPNNSLAREIGVVLDANGFIRVNDDMETNVPGIYAVGDVAGGDVAQVSVAAGHSAIAATAIHASMLSR